MIRNRGLVAKLGRVLALQVALISLAVAAGIYVTYTIVQDSLINEALENEATHFWSLYEQNPQQALPNTNNMLGYLAVGDEMQVCLSSSAVTAAASWVGYRWAMRNLFCMSARKTNHVCI